jgi:glycosyltransferase involved in cell wall biosynthesis
LKNHEIINNFIANCKSFRYQLTEPLALRMARLFFEKDYEKYETNPLISVYVPTYNRAELLIERAVESVLEQTYDNFEFIIVGDHCTDNTEKLISKINDWRIKFYNIPKRGYRYPPTAENHWFAGPVCAANVALRMAQGKWIARIDDDDVWTADHLEVLLGLALEKELEFVSSSLMTIINGKENTIDVKGEFPKIGGTQTWLYRSYLKFMKYNIDCWRKKWNRVNDTDLQDRMYKAGVRMGFLDQVTCFVMPRPGEHTIGLKAYKDQADIKCEEYKFED